MKMLVSDFDNTFFTKNYINNVRKVNKFVDDDNIFVIATGRNISHLLVDVGQITFKYKYLICNDGGIIYDRNLKQIFRKDITKKSLNVIINKIKEYFNIGIYDWFIDTSTMYTKNSKSVANAIIISISNKEFGNKLLQELKLICEDIDGYCTDNWLNIRASETSKKEGIKLLSKIEKIRNKDIYTVGDGINDIDMIKKYNGFCMKNSADELKRVCKNYVHSVEELIEKIK